MSVCNVTGRHQLLVCKTLSSSTASGMTKGSQVLTGKAKGSPSANGHDDGQYPLLVSFDMHNSMHIGTGLPCVLPNAQCPMGQEAMPFTRAWALVCLLVRIVDKQCSEG